jgi:hypothetical protein
LCLRIRHPVPPFASIHVLAVYLNS